MSEKRERPPKSGGRLGESVADDKPKKKWTQNRFYKLVTMKLFAHEYEAITQAAAALEQSVDASGTPLGKVDVSMLVYTAGLKEAAALGFTPDERQPTVSRPPRGEWPNRPERPEESTKEVLNVTIHPLHLRVVQEAARWADASVPVFLLGATLRFIANRKRLEPNNRALQRIKLPPQYQ